MQRPLLKRLPDEISKTLRVNTSSTYYWKNQMITPSWINSPSGQSYVFRDVPIQTLSDLSDQQYMKCLGNPTDIVFRSCSREYLGPNSLRQPSTYWPKHTTMSFNKYKVTEKRTIGNTIQSRSLLSQQKDFPCSANY